LCPKNYPRKQELTSHLIAIHSEQNFKCDECNFSTKTKASLKLHKKRHSSAKPFSCEICGRKFKKKGHLQRHQSIHRTTKDFECKTCGKMFKTRDCLRRHERNVHGKKKTDFASIRRNLTNVSYFPVAKTNFTCNICPSTFTAKIDLNDHSNTHSSDDTENCSICSKQFMKRNLKMHYSRSKCGKKLSSCA
jgi:KRAB domain-containing zinc finger protein